jgi:hypothetical protein
LCIHGLGLAEISLGSPGRYPKSRTDEHGT